MTTKTCIILCGPTAVGKTALAIALARRLGTSIISADSRQCYKELGVAVAKPSAEELAAVPHYFINTHSIYDNITAADFEQYALKAVEEIFAHNDYAVMVGGTGLYIQAFCKGFDAIPAIPANIRNEIDAAYQQNGLSWLQEEVQAADPAYYATGEIQNPRRLLRALEVVRSTGNSITHYQQGAVQQRPFRIILVGLTLPREQLYQQIDQRVLQMVNNGLEQEAKALLPYRHLTALQTVGYRELFDYFDGNTNLAKAIELVQQNTRHYAKRQLTWFKKQQDIHWVTVSSLSPTRSWEKALEAILPLL